MDRDTKKTQLTLGTNGEKTHTEFDFIKDKPHLVYIIKKLERLAGAIHVVTSTLPPEEPIRSVLRVECLLLLKKALFREKKKDTESTLETDIAHCVSLIGIAEMSLLISQMNADVLRYEYLGLLPAIENLYGKERGAVTFDVSGLSVSLDVPKEAMSSDMSHRRHEELTYKTLKRTFKSYDKGQDKRHLKKSYSIKEQKESREKPVDSTREKIILEIIRNKGEVAIKDITTLVRGVSGKTIQRDLLEMVSNGVLKKFGERRWSRYSLV